MNKQPLVSVCMITYGHENYIQLAIERILMQETDFIFELVIANDCSPDNTDQIINNIIETHPKGNLITYHKHKKNIGMMSNFAFALNVCTAKYIALCEGDDYWTDSNKLQKQADFLEKNQEFVLVGHNAYLNVDGIETYNLVRHLNSGYKDYSASDLIKKNPFVTCGVMFKSMDLKEIFPFFEMFTVGDKVLFTYLSFNGKCRFYSSTVGFYRLHENSVTSKNRIDYIPFRDDLINRINHAVLCNNYSNNKYDKEVKEVREYRSKVLTGMALRNYDFKTAIYYSQFVNLKDVKKTRSRIIIKGLRLLS